MQSAAKVGSNGRREAVWIYNVCAGKNDEHGSLRFCEEKKKMMHH